MIAITSGFSKKISKIFLFFSAFVITGIAYAEEIIATTPPLAGLVRVLDPDNEVTCLLSAGSDPHHFQLSPKQVEEMNGASLLVRSSRDDRSWIHLTSSVTVIDLWPETDHAWLLPAAVRDALPELAEAMMRATPQKAPAIRKNLDTALAEVTRIEASLGNALAPLKDYGVIMQHPSWRRVFEAYGIRVLDILESEKHGHELGPRHLEESLSKINEHPHAVLVGDTRHSNRSLEWLSEHTEGRTILYLDGLGDCGETWPELMRRNIDRIEKR